MADGSKELKLDSLSLTLPLPYRVALAIVLGVWGWGINLQYLTRVKIDVATLIRYPTRQSPRTDISYHLSTYRLASILTIPLVLSLLIFWAFSHRSATLVTYFDFLPISYLCLLAGLFLLPLNRISYNGRTRFLQTLRRISIGGLATTENGRFGDILLVDVLTSYARIIADLFISVCLFFDPVEACKTTPLVPVVIAIPSIIRFRQCIIEYRRAQINNRRHGTTNGAQHLANALKYLTTIPVIILGAMQAHTPASSPSTSLHHAFLLAATINSSYTFYWDVTKDWDLTLLAPSEALPSHQMLTHKAPPCLRSKLAFPSPLFYYIAMAVDLFLRFTWLLRLSPHTSPDEYFGPEAAVYGLEMLEVTRRWIWIFFRVETEWVRSLSPGGLGLPGQDDVLLGDFEIGAFRDDDDFDEQSHH